MRRVLCTTEPAVSTVCPFSSITANVTLATSARANDFFFMVLWPANVLSAFFIYSKAWIYLRATVRRDVQRTNARVLNIQRVFFIVLPSPSLFSLSFFSLLISTHVRIGEPEPKYFFHHQAPNGLIEKSFSWGKWKCCKRAKRTTDCQTQWKIIDTLWKKIMQRTLF